MMINCPKCGFFQPEDRYCANCGVDMESFKPKAKPWQSRLTGSSGFYLFLFVIIVISTIYFIYQQKDLVRPDIERSRETIGKRIQEQAEEEQTTATPTSQPAQDTTAPPPLRAQPQKAVQPAQKSLGRAQPAEPQAQRISKPKIKITFVEVPQDQYNTLLENAIGDDQSGIVPSFSEKLSAIKQATQYAPAATVLGSESKNIPETLDPVVLFRGSVDSRVNSDIGLMIQILPTSIDEVGLNTEIRIRRTITDSQGAEPTVDTQVFGGDFSIPFGAAAYFAGTFPHRLIEDEERQYYTSNILRVMTSADFMANTSEFFVFFELMGSPPQ
jgi:hypothetical protein